MSWWLLRNAVHFFTIIFTAASIAETGKHLSYLAHITHGQQWLHFSRRPLSICFNILFDDAVSVLAQVVRIIIIVMMMSMLVKTNVSHESLCRRIYSIQLCLSAGPFRDCLEALEGGYTTSGMYLLKPDNSNRLMQVWCDQRHDPGGWTVILRRQDGSVNFFRNWETYKVIMLA